MIATNHLEKRGCPKCAGRNKTEVEFLFEAKQIHGDKYDYSDLNYNLNGAKVNIICPTHGAFKMNKANHIIGKQGCPLCSESKGERFIKLWLKERNILFIPQKKFAECKNKKQLPFDFYLPDYNTCVEFDGIQHYVISEWFGGKKVFDYIQLNDKIKNEYCSKNNIHLLRIRYDDNIEEKLTIRFSV